MRGAAPFAVGLLCGGLAAAVLLPASCAAPRSACPPCPDVACPEAVCPEVPCPKVDPAPCVCRTRGEAAPSKAQVPSADSISRSAGRVRQQGAERKHDKSLPPVSLLSLSRGQTHCNRNMLLNAQYQTYAGWMELLVYETSFTPSRDLELFAKSALRVPVRYHWYNASARQGSKENPIMGHVRNAICAAARGDILINMDNDDFYHPEYTDFVVSHFVRNHTASMISLVPHSRAMMNPDGTVLIAPDMQMPDGAHAQSFRKSTAKRCRFGGTEYSEEGSFLRCVGAGTRLLLSSWAESTGNALMLVKYQSGVSITQQRYANQRSMYNRMTTEDWKKALWAQQWSYEQMHELSRPGWIKPVELGTPSGGRQYGPRHMRPAAGLGRDVTALWPDFHLRHGDFYSPRNWPYCPGYARLSGMTTYSPTNTEAQSSSALECCRLCAAVSSPQQTCTAFTFHAASRRCSYFVRPGDGVLTPGHNEKKDPLYPLQRLPETVLTHDAGVKVEACPKCSEGLGSVELRGSLRRGEGRTGALDIPTGSG